MTSVAAGRQMTSVAEGRQMTSVAGGRQMTSVAVGRQMTSVAAGRQMTSVAVGRQMTSGAVGRQMTSVAVGRQMTSGAVGRQMTSQAAGRQMTSVAVLFAAHTYVMTSCLNCDSSCNCHCYYGADFSTWQTKRSLKLSSYQDMFLEGRTSTCSVHIARCTTRKGLTAVEQSRRRKS